MRNLQCTLSSHFAAMAFCALAVAIFVGIQPANKLWQSGLVDYSKIQFAEVAMIRPGSSRRLLQKDDAIRLVKIAEQCPVTLQFSLPPKPDPNGFEVEIHVASQDNLFLCIYNSGDTICVPGKYLGAKKFQNEIRSLIDATKLR